MKVSCQIQDSNQAHHVRESCYSAWWKGLERYDTLKHSLLEYTPMFVVQIVQKAQPTLPPTHQPYPVWPVALTVDTCQQTTNGDLLSNLRSGPINLLSLNFSNPVPKAKGFLLSNRAPHINFHLEGLKCNIPMPRLRVIFGMMLTCCPIYLWHGEIGEHVVIQLGGTDDYSDKRLW